MDKELLQRSFHQRPGEAFHLNTLERTQLLRGIHLTLSADRGDIIQLSAA
jgi:hypothetical protein